MPFFEPATQFGGPVAQLPLLLPHVARRGVEISVVTTNAGCRGRVATGRWIRRDGYRVWYAAVAALAERPPFWCPSMRRPLRRAIARADAVHACLSFTHSVLQSAWTARQFGKPYIYTPRGCLSPAHLAIKPRLKQAWSAVWERRIVCRAAALHALTQEEIADVESFCGKRVPAYQIPNAVEPFPVTDGMASDMTNKLAGFEMPAGRMILTLCSLQPIKRLDLLLQAVRRVAVSKPDVWLAIGGRDLGSRAEWETLASTLGLSERVLWLGHLDADQKRAALNRASLFALTSDAEGMPNAALEALSAGVPCVLTRGCRLPEVEAEGAGRVVGPDPEAIATGLHELLGDEDRLRSARQRARRLAAQRFSPEAVADAVVRMYADLLERPTLSLAEAGPEP